MHSNQKASQAKPPGSLAVVATPIGNLNDVSRRAIETLRSANAIICEDTRVTRKLLSHLEISVPLISLHHHSGREKYEEVIEKIADGGNLAMVSDAGTPGVSDPGNMLIRKLVDSLGERVRITAVPGPSALTAALSISGLPSDRFLFLGFLPHKKGRETLFRKIIESQETVVFFESPHRILKTLERLDQLMTPERPMVIVREATKMYEERVGETVSECHNLFQSNPQKVKGEFVVIVGVEN
ncbi:MAG: 16S rRNA (cytidine(1402)-2'-O)-methyltransferase [bacterium]|nr:16S rRNA (cytidine(1402)-2'-O)-methyltransferase [bacterium]